MPLEVAIATWKCGPDSVSRKIKASLHDMGCNVSYFKFDSPIPEFAEVIFTYAPWERLQQITRQLAQIPSISRPAWVHWNTEDPPDLRIPWPLLLLVGRGRAWFDRLNDSDNNRVRTIPSWPILRWINTHLHKFRYVGEYYYAQRHGYLTVLADISKVYADFFTSNGLESLYVPWGLAADSEAEVKLEQDLDVLWLGIRRTKRRSKLLDKVREQLSKHGIDMYVVDGVERPYIHGEKRNRLVSRAKITLNLLPTWYDNTLVYRFPIAAANGSMVVSEATLPHCPMHKNNVHYVAIPPDKIVPTILYYLENERERQQITEAAYQFVIQEQKLEDSVKAIMSRVAQLRRLRKVTR